MPGVVRGGGRPKQYRTTSGDRVASVTTIIGNRKDCGGLVHAAWKLGTEGKDYRQEWGRKASAGNYAHDMIECDIHNEPYVEPERVDVTREQFAEMLANARRSFDSYRRWSAAYDFEPLYTEMPIVNDAMGFGGTLDCVGRVGGQVCLLDWKTGKFHQDHVIQLGAYHTLWGSSAYAKAEAVGDAHILCFARDTGNFTHHQIGQATLELGAKQFAHLLNVYNLDKQLKKAV